MPVTTIGSAEAALWLGVTRGRLQALLRQRRIRGARFVGRTWLIPVNFADYAWDARPEAAQA